MTPDRSKIIISKTWTEPVTSLKAQLNPGEIGIRVLSPRELRFDFICRNEVARDTLIYLLERITACVTFKEVEG